MSKMKTKSGAKKRFRMTGSGKVRMNNAFMRHMQTNKPQKMKRKARGTSVMCEADARIGKVYGEIFPSIFALDQDDLIQRFPDQAYHINDAVQVRTSTEAFLQVRRADWDAAYPSDLLDDRVREEGWIAGISMTYICCLN